MVDRPILFSTPMVHALLAGRKSQTRRVIEPYEPTLHPTKGSQAAPEGLFRLKLPAAHGGFDAGPMFKRRYAPGDRLWVRETHAFVGSVDPGWLLYRASGYEAECERHGFDFPFPPESQVRWRPSLYMPRWASRLTLVVTGVRVERLQEISDADARAEGIRLMKGGGGVFVGREGPGSMVTPWPSAAEAFSDLWDQINGPGAWDANPWVCAVSFTTHHCNIDQLRAGE